MAYQTKPAIHQADKIDDTGVIITFQDGMVAVYSASLLYSFLSQANEVKDPETHPL